MIWDSFIYFALFAVVCWALGAWMSWKERPRWAFLTTVLGLAAFFTYILWMWFALERPPMRTMGETRLWYSFFLPLAGIVIYGRWRYRWILSFTTVMAVVFIAINLLKPEIHSKTLMPALQSPWFAPHVIVYMLAYALLGVATLIALYGLFSKHAEAERESLSAENLVLVGFAFLTLGILMGALWAKDAWGHYWAWDPKETWAAVTWFAYLAYIHFVRYDTRHRKLSFWLLIVCFCLLQMCWWGINYLPSAQATSVHTYSMQ
jgi:ABC-type transport system involved in cytochrome c biogenesis permease subunit